MIYFLQFGDVHTYPSQIFSRQQSLHKKHQEFAAQALAAASRNDMQKKKLADAREQLELI
jgi:hypothetical protein